LPLIDYVNNEYRTKTVSEILTKGNTDGEEGLSKEEVKTLIKNGHNKKSFVFGLAKTFWGVSNMTNSVFKAMDANKDNIISLEECDAYAKKECNVTLNDIWNLSVADVCNLLDKK